MLFLMFSCQHENKLNIQIDTDSEPNLDFFSVDSNNFQSNVEFGNYLVRITCCHNSHTPKILTPDGYANDLSRALSGFPQDIKLPEIDRENIELAGLSVTKDFNVWFGTLGSFICFQYYLR